MIQECIASSSCLCSLYVHYVYMYVHIYKCICNINPFGVLDIFVACIVTVALELILYTTRRITNALRDWNSDHYEHNMIKILNFKHVATHKTHNNKHAVAIVKLSLSISASIVNSWVVIIQL